MTTNVCLLLQNGGKFLISRKKIFVNNNDSTIHTVNISVLPC